MIKTVDITKEMERLVQQTTTLEVYGTQVHLKKMASLQVAFQGFTDMTKGMLQKQYKIKFAQGENAIDKIANEFIISNHEASHGIRINLLSAITKNLNEDVITEMYEVANEKDEYDNIEEFVLVLTTVLLPHAYTILNELEAK